ncbi:MAG TPA: T9SS type A sorting domain-containing protein [Crocinitomicaceae bacterium]|nr:T9SS type A sorting domain-containing protein [Crocinitomicaceae bacterium]
MRACSVKNRQNIFSITKENTIYPPRISSCILRLILSSSTEEKAIIDLSRPFEVSIYPNPSTGLVTFDFPENEEGELTIEVYDLTGKRMHSESWSDTNGQQIDLSDLHKGMYLVKISIDKVLVTTQSLKLQ